MEDRQKLNELLPLLDTLSRQHPDDSVREMATDLRIAIATHGHVLSEALRQASLNKTATAQNQRKSRDTQNAPRNEVTLDIAPERKKEPKKPLIEVISSHEEGSEVAGGAECDTAGHSTDVLDSAEDGSGMAGDAAEEKSELDVALEELMDPLSKF